MIIKFKPHDFEECLMGLPLENWLLVDDVRFLEETLDHDFVRPQMMISHLEELKGVHVSQDMIKIRCFTSFDHIFKNDHLPEYFKTVLQHAKATSMFEYETLGCYLSSMHFDRILYPMMVATDATFIVKSYIKEREVEFKKFTVTGKVQFHDYNEIMYEMVIPKQNYQHVVAEAIEFDEILGGSAFSYFIGYNTRSDIRMAIMLPNKKIIRCEQIEKMIKDHHFKLTATVRLELLKIYNTFIRSLRLQLKYKENIDKIFEDVVWQPLKKVLKG